MDTFALILLIAALILFLVAAFGIVVNKINLMALGLACWVLAVILESPLVKK